MEDAILADAPGAAIGQCEAGTAAPEPARPIHKTSTVYSAEFKAQAVSDFLKVRGRTTRAEFARSRGIPPGTFDGWYWKAMGLKRGHAKEPSAIAAAADPNPPAIDVTYAMKGIRQPAATARVRVNGVEIEADADGMRMLLEAIRCLA